METVDYYDVLQQCADLCGLDRENLSVREQAILRGFLSQRLLTAWQYQLWPDLVRWEKRYFRPLWEQGIDYVRTDEVYDGVKRKYYQCLVANLDQEPPNPAYWGDCQTSYSADDVSDQTYVLGDIVFDPYEDAFLQMVDDGLTFIPLVEFRRTVDLRQEDQTPIGSVLGVWDKNRRADLLARRVEYKLSERGIEVIEDVVFVWVNFRLPCPVLSGDKWSATRTYAVGDQAYYRNSATGFNGNFYRNLSAAVGDSPESAPTLWDLLEIPKIFEGYMKHGAAADYLMPQGEDEAGPQRAIAEMLLADQAAVLLGQESQGQRAEVMTR